MEPQLDPTAPTLAHPPRPERRVILVLISLIVLLAVASSVLFVLVPRQEPLPTPIATATFDDGFKVDFLKAEVATTASFEVLSAKPWPFVPTLSNSHTYGGASMEVSREITNGRLTNASIGYQRDTPGLHLQIIARDADQHLFASSDFVARDSIATIQRKDGAFERFETRPFVKGKPLTEEIELVFEVEDGVGGWMLADGPVIMDEREGRGFVLRPSFPRRSPTLKIRVSRTAHPPVVVEIPTPGYAPSFPVLVPDTLPATRNGSNFKVLLSSLHTWPDGTLTPTFWVSGIGLPDNAFESSARMVDAMGNWWPTTHCIPLPGETNVRVLIDVDRRLSSYPWEQSEVTEIATGTWPMDTALPSATLTPGAQAMGIQSIKFSPPPAKKYYLNAQGQKVPYRDYAAEFTMEGRCSASQLATFQRDYDGQYVAWFWDGRRSEGELESSSGHSGYNSSSAWFGLTCRWCGKPKPGMVFHLALIPKQKPKTVEFVAELRPSFDHVKK